MAEATPTGEGPLHSPTPEERGGPYLASAMQEDSVVPPTNPTGEQFQLPGSEMQSQLPGFTGMGPKQLSAQQHATAENVALVSCAAVKNRQVREVTQPSLADAQELLDFHRLANEYVRESAKRMKVSDSTTTEGTSLPRGLPIFYVCPPQLRPLDLSIKFPKPSRLPPRKRKSYYSSAQASTSSAAEVEAAHGNVAAQSEASAGPNTWAFPKTSPFYGAVEQFHSGSCFVDLTEESPFFKTYEDNISSRINSVIEMYVGMPSDNPPVELADVHVLMPCVTDDIAYTPHECRDVLTMMSMILLFNLFMLDNASQLEMTLESIEDTRKLVKKFDDILEAHAEKYSILATDDFRRKQRIYYALEDLKEFVRNKNEPPRFRMELQLLQLYHEEGSKEPRWILGAPSDPLLQQNENSFGKGLFYYAMVFRNMTHEDQNFLYYLRSLLNEEACLNDYVELGLILVSNEARKFADAGNEASGSPPTLRNVLLNETLTFEDLSRDAIDIYLSTLRSVLNQTLEDTDTFREEVTFSLQEYMRVLNIASKTLVCNIHIHQDFLVAAMVRQDIMRNLGVGLFMSKSVDILSSYQKVSKLWRKLLSFRNPLEVKRCYASENCCICKDGNLVQKDEFIIFENCDHIICYRCCEILDEMSQCPRCDADLPSYTSFNSYQRHFYGRMTPWAPKELQYKSKLTVRTRFEVSAETERQKRYEDSSEDLLVGRSRKLPLMPEAADAGHGSGEVPEAAGETEATVQPPTPQLDFFEEIEQIIKHVLSSPERKTKNKQFETPRESEILPKMVGKMVTVFVLPYYFGHLKIKSPNDDPNPQSSENNPGTSDSALPEQTSETASEQRTGEQSGDVELLKPSNPSAGSNTSGESTVGAPVGAVVGGAPVGAVVGGAPVGAVVGGAPVGAVVGGAPVGLANPNTKVTLGSLSAMLPPTRKRTVRKRSRADAREKVSAEGLHLRSLLQGNDPNFPRYGRPDRVLAREYHKKPE